MSEATATRPVKKGHGGPYDRGAADYYYWRPRRPHFNDDNHRRVTEKDMTPEEISAYHAGYDKAEEFGDRKDFD